MSEKYEKVKSINCVKKDGFGWDCWLYMDKHRKVSKMPKYPPLEITINGEIEGIIAERSYGASERANIWIQGKSSRTNFTVFSAPYRLEIHKEVKSGR